MHYQLEIMDGSDTRESFAHNVKVDLRSYHVLRPLFKNGRTYQVGQVIELDSVTGKRFEANGDIKEI